MRLRHIVVLFVIVALCTIWNLMNGMSDSWIFSIRPSFNVTIDPQYDPLFLIFPGEEYLEMRNIFWTSFFLALFCFISGFVLARYLIKIWQVVAYLFGFVILVAFVLHFARLVDITFNPGKLVPFIDLIVYFAKKIGGLSSFSIAFGLYSGIATYRAK